MTDALLIGSHRDRVTRGRATSHTYLLTQPHVGDNPKFRRCQYVEKKAKHVHFDCIRSVIMTTSLTFSWDFFCPLLNFLEVKVLDQNSVYF